MRVILRAKWLRIALLVVSLFLAFKFLILPHLAVETWPWQAIMVSIPLWLTGIALILVFVRIGLGNSRDNALQTSLPGKEAQEVKTTFADIGGLERVKEALKPITAWLSAPQGSLGDAIPRGVLITGPSGTGKTLLAYAIAGEAKVGLLSYSGAEFNELLIGMGSSRMRKAFADARAIKDKDRPCILLIDQVDLIGSERSSSSIPYLGGEQETYKTLAQLLAELDNLNDNGRVYVIATTSRPRVLDPALVGPGRLSARVDLKMPNTRERAEILAIHMRGKPLSTDIDFQRIAENTEDFSGAELEQLVTKACEFAKERTEAGGEGQTASVLSMADFKQAKGQMLPQPKRNLPQKIMAHLDEYVIGQDEAKKHLAVAVSNHYLRLSEARGVASPPMSTNKANVLMIGPTGSGKTMLIETIAGYLDVPYVIFNSTVLTGTGHGGANVEQILYQLIVAADLNLRWAGHGIVCIDEFDKLAFNQGERTRFAGAAVQQELLKIIEGAVVDVPKGGGQRNGERPDFYQFNTKNILFICLGAFAHIEKVIEQRLNQSNGTVKHGLALLKEVQPEDVINHGFIPELIGRFPIITFTKELTRTDLAKILNNPKNGLLPEYRTLLEWQGWHEPEFTDGAIDLITQEALRRRVGARGLRGILEEALLDKMYLRPEDKSEPQKLTIDEVWIKEALHIEQAHYYPLLQLPPNEAVQKIRMQLDEHLSGNAIGKRTLAITSYGHYRSVVDRAHSERVPDEPSHDQPARGTTPPLGAPDQTRVAHETLTRSATNQRIALLVDPYLGQRSKLVRGLAAIWGVPLAEVHAELLEHNLNSRAGQPFAWIFEPIHDLLKQADYSLEKAQQGILFIDGFDKVVGRVVMNAGHVSLAQQVCEVIQRNSLLLQWGNGREFEFKTQDLLIVLGGDFVFSDRRQRSSQDAAAIMARYQPANIMDSIWTEFAIPPDLLRYLLVVPLDLALKKDELGQVIQKEDDQLRDKYQDMIALAGPDLGDALPDPGQLLEEAHAGSWKVSEIRLHLESQFLKQLYNEQVEEQETI